MTNFADAKTLSLCVCFDFHTENRVWAFIILVIQFFYCVMTSEVHVNVIDIISISCVGLVADYLVLHYILSDCGAGCRQMKSKWAKSAQRNCCPRGTQYFFALISHVLISCHLCVFSMRLLRFSL